MSTKKRILRKIDDLFADTSVSQTRTFEELKEIIIHCKELQEALDEADQNQ